MTASKRYHQLQIVFNDLTAIWNEFLPYIQKCWKTQQTSPTAGNCHDWWKSRFYDFYIGHGGGRRDHNTFEMFPEFWQQYGHLLQQGRRATP